MRILIGSPSADGEVEPIFAQAILGLVGRFLATRPDISFAIEMPEGRSVSFARDVLANRVLQSDDFTHLLFIDTDMGFNPELIERMIALDRPVVGTIAPQRHRDLDAWSRLSRELPTPIAAEVCSVSYTPDVSDLDLVGMDPDDDASKAGFIPALQTGAGILLIRRDVFETMRLVCPELAETAVRPAMAAIGLTAPLVRFFSYSHGRTGILVGEDLSFTTRWRERCGGEIWVAPDGAIRHAGTRVVTGDFRRRMALTGET